MNKRETPRYECRVPLLDERKEFINHTHTTDISRTGVGFVSPRFLPINSKLVVELALTRDENPVLVEGRVKWIEKIPHSSHFRIGMNFSDVSMDAQSRIERYFPASA